MFSFFKRHKNATPNSNASGSQNKTHASDETVNHRRSVNENVGLNASRKDVVNLLLPTRDYQQPQQKTGVSAMLHSLMAKKNRRNRLRGRLKNINRTESCKEMATETPPEMKHEKLQRCHSQADDKATCTNAPVVDSSVGSDVTDAFARDKNKTADADSIYESVPDLSEQADFVKDIVLQKYASTRQNKKPHVSLVYIAGGDEKRHAEELLNEIAKSIDCTLEDRNLMGSSDSKNERKVNENPKRGRSNSDPEINYLKQGLQNELDRLLDKHKGVEIVEVFDDEECAEFDENSVENDEFAKSEKIVPEYIVTEEKYEVPTMIIDSQEFLKDAPVETKSASPFNSPDSMKKSNLKPPRSDGEGASDDERSENGGKKKVTFRKVIFFDDGDELTDPEDESSYDSLTDEDSDIPDNDELLGGVVVARNDDKVIITELEDDLVDFKKLSNDNSDSGFIEGENTNSSVKIDECESSESVLSSDDGADESSVEEEELFEEEETFEEDDDRKSLVNQEDKFQSQVAQLTELANARSTEADKVKDQVQKYRKDIDVRDQDIERLKSDLAAAYKESELIKQRSKSLEEELAAARTCSADLADKLNHDGSTEELLRQDLESSDARCSELEYRVQELEDELARLQREREEQEIHAAEVLAIAEAKTAKWRKAHESARNQAAATAERLLADCEWKMRELEKRARDAERINGELTNALERSKKVAAQQSHLAELQQLRGVVTEQQHSVVALTQQLRRLEASEDALKVEVHQLRELLELERAKNKQMEIKHKEEIQNLRKESTATLEQTRADMQRAHAAARTSLERAHAERTRTAIAQLRSEHERAEKNAERKLREANTKLENLKEELESKQNELQEALEEVRGRTDWELMQLRHLLDRADIQYANQIEQLNMKHEKEIEELIEEWSAKLKNCELEAEQAAEEASRILNTTKFRMEQERTEHVNRLKEQHKQEMDEQWEQFMFDKEECLARMKLECKQEGDEEREKAERELIREIQELKSELATKDSTYGELSGRADAVGRTLAVTEQELREALDREKELRMQKSDNCTKQKQMERAYKEQIEHLNRKCACLKKLFDDIRTRLAAREQAADEESKSQQKEIQRLKSEVARLTKLLIEAGSPLEPRTRADGCDKPKGVEKPSNSNKSQTNTTRRKGGGYELKKRNMSDTKFPILPEAPRQSLDDVNHRQRANSVDLPAVQVPGRIKQLEDRIGTKLEY